MEPKKNSKLVSSSVLTGVIALVLALLLVLNNTAMLFATIISTTLDQPMFKVEETSAEEQGDSEYFKSSYSSQEKLEEDARALSREIEAEGMVLLKNEDNCLPLGKDRKVSLFSESSVDMLYSGTGSGQVSTTGVPTLKDALEGVGYSVNDTLWSFYEGNHEQFKRERMSWNPFENAQGVYRVNECPASEYTDAVKDSFAKFGDAAIFVYARSGGEQNDLNLTSDESNGSFLSLTDDEASVIQMLQDDPSFDKIIVLVNAGNMPELGWVEQYSKVKAVLWIGYVGHAGMYAVADALTGDVNPSGRLPDTIAYNPSAAPAAINTDDNTYVNTKEIEDLYGYFNVPSEYHYQNKYVAYQEGIYVGYRYYETRYEDVVLNQGNAGAYNYAQEVQYPFGFGLSYTRFAYSDFKVTEKGSTYTAAVTVTNTGDTAGKEVVQLYAQKPYTDYAKANRLEKASVELVGFAKTDVLNPGASQTVTITVDREMLKSYDTYGAGTYIIDGGTHFFAVGKDAHDALNNILAAKGKTSGDGMTADGNAALTASFDLKFDDKTYSVSTATGADIVNTFEFADLNHYWGDITYLSRSDWQGTFPAHLELTAPKQLIDDLSTEKAYIQENPEDDMPVLGENIGMQLISLQGVDYDDPEWEAYLNQMTAQEMFDLLQLDGWRIMATPSIGNPGATDKDGPQGISASIGGISESEGIHCMAYPSSIVLAASFNTDLARRMGDIIGEEGLYADVSGWYAPAVNTHRNAFAGRNFEYYSEDPVLSGKLACQQVLGAQSKGMYCYVKHFALNDQETNRHSYSAFANEQSIREIYLYAFELTIVGGDAKGIMSSYQRIGAKWTGASSELLNHVLREEWGFDGMVLTDSANIGYANMHILAGIGNGNDAWLNTNAENYLIPDMASRPTLLNAMRQACHRVLYVLVNSSAMNGISKTTKVVRVTPVWMTLMYIADAVIVAACAVGAFFVFRRSYKAEGGSKAVKIAVPAGVAVAVFIIAYNVLTYVAYLAAQSF